MIRPRDVDAPENPQAFPGMSGGAGSIFERHNDGMTLRDWFAGQALAGIACSTGVASSHAEKAYLYADAMLAERERTA